MHPDSAGSHRIRVHHPPTNNIGHDMKARYYQENAVGEVMNYLDEEEGHPLIVMPTGSGKTKVILDLIDAYLTDNPLAEILVVSHVQEILEQNYKSIHSEYGRFCGLYSAGLGHKEIKKITVAGIQSIFRTDHFNSYDLVIIDECHLIPTKGEGMYRTFLAKLTQATYVGLTATHFRLGHGYIHKGKGALFTDIAYDLSSPENFQRLVEEGYLSRLILKSTEATVAPEMTVQKVRTVAGDYNLLDLSSAYDRESVTAKIVEEIVRMGKNYKKWLIFAIDINHAEHIAGALNLMGIKTACVHSQMKQDRKETITAIKNGEYRAVVNVDVLTTGFDVPDIDLIAMVRPTKSPVVYVQSIGRGLRTSPNKDHCLVLDFAGNVMRLGPIDDVHIIQKGEVEEGGGEAVMKTCPECGVMDYAAIKVCKVCGYQFEFEHHLESSAGGGDLVTRGVDTHKKSFDEPTWIKVDEVSYSIHSKKGKPDNLRVSYRSGLNTFTEWIFIGYKGWARSRAEFWVSKRYEGEYQHNAHDLLSKSAQFKVPSDILIKRNGEYTNVEGYQFHKRDTAEVLQENDIPF